MTADNAHDDSPSFVVPDDTTPSVPWFDFRHLARLHQLGLLKRLPIEMGPLPSFPFGPEVDRDLREWNIIDTGGSQAAASSDGNPGGTSVEGVRLTPQAEEVIRGIDDWDTAVWGVVLLRDYRVNLDISLPEEFLHFGVDKAIRTTPRVTFMITRRGDLMTTAVASSGMLDISAEYVTDNPDAYMADTLRSILDPDNKWPPYPLQETVTLPLDAAVGAATEIVDPDGPDTADVKKMLEEGMLTDEVEHRRQDLAAEARERLVEVIGATQETLMDSGVSRFGAKVLANLLNVHECALAQVKASIRGSTDTVVSTAASTMSFLDGGKDDRGVVVAYPSCDHGDQVMVTFVPGTRDAYVKAVAGVLDVAHSMGVSSRSS